MAEKSQFLAQLNDNNGRQSRISYLKYHNNEKKYPKNLVPLLSRFKSLCQVQPVWKEFSVQWDSFKMIYEIDLE